MTAVAGSVSWGREASVPAAGRGGTVMRGRDAEWRAVGGLLGRARTGVSGVLLVEGGRGAGKSALLREAGRKGSGEGFSVAAGAADRLGGRLPLFALRTAAGLAGDDGGPPGPGPLPAQAGAVRERLARRAQDGPVLVMLDDLQWAGRETLLALRVLPRELARYPVAWILARSPAPRSRDAGDLFAALEGEGAVRVALGPLSAGAVTAVLTDAFGAPPDDGLLELAGEAGGNPSLLCGLIDGWREENTVRVAGGRAGLPPGAGVPRRACRAAREQLDVSEPARRLLQAAAVAGGRFRPGDAARLAGTAPAALLPGIEEALDAGIIVADGEELCFRHPLTARAAAESVPEPARRLLHRQYAQLLLDRGGPAAEAAGHLLQGAAAGDPGSLAGLDAGARRLLHRSPPAAAGLAVRALELTAPGGPAAAARAAAAAEALAAAGRPGQAARTARDALARPLPAPAEARLRCALAASLAMSGPSADAAREAGPVLTAPGPRRTRDDALGPWLQAAAGRPGTPAGPAAAAVLARPREHAPHAVTAAQTAQAMSAWDQGRTARALGLLRQAARQDGISPDARRAQPLLLLAARLTDLRRLDEAASLLQAAGAPQPHDGLAGLITALLRARLHLARGQPGPAADTAAAAHAAAHAAGAAAYASAAASLLASAALRQGHITDAARHLAGRAVRPPHAAAPYAPAETCLAPAQAAAASAGPAAAAGRIRRLCADPPALRRALLGDPASPAWLVRTALAAGRQPLAAAVLAAAEDLSSPHTPALTAAAAHARALTAAARAPALTPTDRDALAQAAARHPDPWARASAAEDLAALDTSTARDETARRLNQALDGYTATGATADAARVRARLRQLGIRRRHWTAPAPGTPAHGWESLTPTEHAVAELIAQGLTNQQAATRMYISPHTIAHHLRQTYRKLSIQSRVELTRIVIEHAQH